MSDTPAVPPPADGSGRAARPRRPRPGPVRARDPSAGRRRAAELTRDQSRLSAEDVEQRVELEVLDALRGVSISAKRWRAALVTLEKTARKLELAEKAVRLGKLGFSEFNILQFQDELTAARLSVNQNYADYLRSRTAPLRAEGRILSARGLTAE